MDPPSPIEWAKLAGAQLADRRPLAALETCGEGLARHPGDRRLTAVLARVMAELWPGGGGPEQPQAGGGEPVPVIRAMMTGAIDGADTVAAALAFRARLRRGLATPPPAVEAWGEGLFAVAERATALAEFALALNAAAGGAEGPTLRLMLDAGPVVEAFDPLIGRSRVFGATPRPPAAVAGQVHATPAFAALLAGEAAAGITCVAVDGDLYRLNRAAEPPMAEEWEAVLAADLPVIDIVAAEDDEPPPPVGPTIESVLKTVARMIERADERPPGNRKPRRKAAPPLRGPETPARPPDTAAVARALTDDADPLWPGA